MSDNGLYEETGNGSIGEKPIRPVYRKIIDVGLFEKNADNGCIRGEAMAGL